MKPFAGTGSLGNWTYGTYTAGIANVTRVCQSSYISGGGVSCSATEPSQSLYCNSSGYICDIGSGTFMSTQTFIGMLQFLF